VKQYLGALFSLARREPVATFAVIRSLALVVAAFWPGFLTPDQSTAILGLAVALLGGDAVVHHNVKPTVVP
jgi:hypothetical protein